MPIIDILLILAFFGLIVWLLLKAPLPAQIKTVILWVAIIGAALWLIKIFGILDKARQVTV